MRSLEELDRWIATKVKRLSGTQPQRRELLEIRRDILEDVRGHIEAKGGGKYVFPYNEVAIHLAAQDDAQRELLEAALAQEEALADDIRELLAEAGCPIPKNFQIVLDLDAAPFGVGYYNRKPRAEQPIAAIRPQAKLIVTKGNAEPLELDLAANRINLGRLKEVAGEKDGLRRRNDLAFDASETTVSREHGSVRYDAASARFRICDDQSARGISVFRDGRRIGVPRASSRGVQLQAGDEIHLGDACIRFEIEGS
jgi:FHA domain-containing protein